MLPPQTKQSLLNMFDTRIAGSRVLNCTPLRTLRTLKRCYSGESFEVYSFDISLNVQTCSLDSIDNRLNDEDRRQES